MPILARGRADEEREFRGQVMIAEAQVDTQARGPRPQSRQYPGRGYGRSGGQGCHPISTDVKEFQFC